jgi:RNA polymerase sigma factor (TIGR02999 family)
MQTELESTSSSAAGKRVAFATDEVLGKVYDELRALAAYHMERERPGHTLPPTAVVHEVYLRLAKQDKTAWANRAQFLAIASGMIRRVLVDHARARAAHKREAARRVPLEDFEPSDREQDADIDGIDEALNELAKLDERQARVVELRYFGGLSIEETAEALGVSPGTVKGDWRLARAWLAARLR